DIILAQANGSDSQKFTIICSKDGSYSLLSVVSGGLSCADVYNISTIDGANICQWNYWGGDGQKFILEPAESAPEKVIGDVNADGIFSILDAVMMQKYLHGLENLTDMEAGELTGDGRINILDLSVMKDMLIKA
ncbi:MAG: dockerin type I domain-containing protein, partial [Ruminococcus sp.]